MVKVPHVAVRLASLFSARLRSNLAADAGDASRNSGEWLKAAGHYRKSVKIRPARRAIWVQLGHALKEAGLEQEALAAYRSGSALIGDDGDAPLHHGVLAKQLGLYPESKTQLLQACRENPLLGSARTELLEVLHDPRSVSADSVKLAGMLALAERDRLGTRGSDGLPSTVFDASDLISYFRHSRLPTGIQRVQMEVICSAVATRPLTQIACFTDDQNAWSRIPAGHFLALCKLAVTGRDQLDPAWIKALETLAALIAQNAPVEFTKGGFLVNLGTSWWLQNYFLHVRAAQRQYGIHYVPFVHDFIPVITPEHCIQQLTQDFLSWTYGVFDHASFFLVNSRSTQTDLHKVAQVLGHQLEADRVSVIPLDADFRNPALAHLMETDLQRWNLRPQGFVLFVSTVESRKNHLTALHAWREMIDRHGVDKVPDLVCVGNRGWLNDHVYALLDKDPVLGAKVHMLSQLTDEELALLYRQCRFTIYPSSYEGWGLPVTESLCYGKVPVITRCSSLPEAGGDFAVYVEVGSVVDLVAAVEQLWCNPDHLAMLEAKIKSDFQPRSWRDVAQQVQAQLLHFGAIMTPSEPDAPSVDLGKFYRFNRNRQRRLVKGAARGEALRQNTGWWALEDWGCWTKPDGALIAFQLSEAPDHVTCYLHMRAPAGSDRKVFVRVEDGEHVVNLPAGQSCWVSIDSPVTEGQVHLILRTESLVETNLEATNRRQIGVGISGLIVTNPVIAPDLEATARYLAQSDGSDYAFLRDIFQLLLDSQVDGAALEDYLLPLETGGMTRGQVLADLLRLDAAKNTLARYVPINKLIGKSGVA